MTDYAFCDLNGDGLDDLVTSNAADSELLVLLADGAERFALPQSYPTFSEVKSVSSGRFYSGGGESLAVISSAEKVVGMSRLDASGRLSFPRPIRLAGDEAPEVSVAMDMDRDGLDELLLVVSTKRSNFLLCMMPEDRGDELSGWVETSRYELSSLRRKPHAAKALDVFGTERQGLMLFVARDAPLFLVSDVQSPFEFTELASQSAVRESLLKDVLPSQVSAFDVDGDGRDELVVGRKGYARALRFDGDAIEMIDQFNARRGEDVVSCVVPVVRSGEVLELMFYVGGSGEFHLLKREGCRFPPSPNEHGW